VGIFRPIIYNTIILIIAFFMVSNPAQTIGAAKDAFMLWALTILPALFPFFIVAELLISLGLVRFLGILLEPIMRPVFGLPGCSSLVVAMGFTSGFPVGAVMSKRLYDEGMLTGEEMERLVSFTNNSSPLFIIGAVGIGMFGSPTIGYLLAVSHYLANLLVGLCWGFRSGKTKSDYLKGHILHKAVLSLAETGSRIKGGIGSLLGKAIKSSVSNILAIAGFIVFFSILTRMLSVWGIMDIFARAFMHLLPVISLPYQIAYGMSMGIFEITIGLNTLVATDGHLLAKLLVASIVMAFSGFSIIAQILSIVAGTPVRLSFYLQSRLLQIVFSSIITYLGYSFVIVPRGVSCLAVDLPYYKILYAFDAWSYSLLCLAVGLGIIGLLVVVRIRKT
jgi:sporulation integral membrane protein YlbJ